MKISSNVMWMSLACSKRNYYFLSTHSLAFSLTSPAVPSTSLVTSLSLKDTRFYLLNFDLYYFDRRDQTSRPDKIVARCKKRVLSRVCKSTKSLLKRTYSVDASPRGKKYWDLPRQLVDLTGLATRRRAALLNPIWTLEIYTWFLL